MVVVLVWAAARGVLRGALELACPYFTELSCRRLRGMRFGGRVACALARSTNPSDNVAPSINNGAIKLAVRGSLPATTQRGKCGDRVADSIGYVAGPEKYIRRELRQFYFRHSKSPNVSANHAKCAIRETLRVLGFGISTELIVLAQVLGRFFLMI